MNKFRGKPELYKFFKWLEVLITAGFQGSIKYTTPFFVDYQGVKRFFLTVVSFKIVDIY